MCGDLKLCEMHSACVVISSECISGIPNHRIINTCGHTHIRMDTFNGCFVWSNPSGPQISPLSLAHSLIITVCVVYRNYLPIPDPLYSRYNIIAPCVVVVYNWGASIIIISEETAISRDIGITFNFHS